MCALRCNSSATGIGILKRPPKSCRGRYWYEYRRKLRVARLGPNRVGILNTAVLTHQANTSVSHQTVGVIFKTERDSFRVLDQNGQARLVQPHQITMRKDSNRAIAVDSEGHELRIGDNVKEVDGEVRILRHCVHLERAAEASA